MKRTLRFTNNNFVRGKESNSNLGGTAVEAWNE